MYSPVVVPPPLARPGPARRLAELLDVFADAFARRDAERMADCYAVPAVVLTAGRTVVYSSRGEMVEGFASTLEHHRATGLTSVGYAIRSESMLDRDLFEAVVRWDHGDAAGEVRCSDAYRYLLRRQDRSGLLIEVAAAVSGAAVDELVGVDDEARRQVV